MSPEKFKFDLLEEAYRLCHTALANAPRFDLDGQTAMWVITMEAWRDFMASADFVPHVGIQQPGRRNELFGLLVRVTISDEPDVPRIQLVFEPVGRPRPPGGQG